MQTYGFKYLLITLGITAILFGCSSKEKLEESVSEVSKSSRESGSSFLTSPSPNQVHIIDFQEMSIGTIDEKDKKINFGYSSFRIYYGEYGRKLEKYKEFDGFDLTNIDTFDVNWQDDNVVLIDVYRKAGDGTRFKDETIHLDTSI